MVNADYVVCCFPNSFGSTGRKQGNLDMATQFLHCVYAIGKVRVS